MEKIFVAGHRGMAGSAIIRALQKTDNSQIITRTRSQLDLTNQQAVDDFFATEKPNQVYLAAAKVGGILANNTYPADFIYQNLIIQANVIHAAFKHGVKKLIFLGSSCIYPKFAPQPIQEQALLTDKLEPTNQPYAIAKIAGIKLCESYNRQYGETHGVDYRCLMPTNLYGQGDNYHPQNSHVVAGLIRRFHEAKINQSEEVVVWGTGSPLREFLFVDDLADACLHVMNLDKTFYQKHCPLMESHINVGAGVDISIKDLANIISQIVGYQGTITFDTSKPDGTPKKLMDNSLLKKLGWEAKMTLNEGLKIAYLDFLNNDKATKE